MLPRATLCRMAPGAACFAALALATDAGAGNWIDYHEFSGRVSAEDRWYPQPAAHSGQRAHALGFVVEPKLYLEDEKNRSLTFEMFYRYDSADPHRTHADLRAAYLLLFGETGDGEWELRAGVDRVFWGVAESRHLVDIVNQTDFVEHPNEETKLGQPMVHLTWSGDWGVAELFGLPYHRARTFPGRRGRLRTPFVVDNDRVSYESAAGEWHFDFAVRYSHVLGPLDLGVSVFDGTSREPVMVPAGTPGGVPALVPHYEQIRQFGLDTQITTGPWLLKLEAIRRTGARNRLSREEDYTALVTGFEYTFYSAFGTAADLGLLGEWHRDGRSSGATNQFQSDVFFGMRLGLNDVQGTEMLVSVLADTDYVTRTLVAEASRRISDRWSMELEAVAFLNVDDMDIAYATRRDSFIGLNLIYSF